MNWLRRLFRKEAVASTMPGVHSIRFDTSDAAMDLARLHLLQGRADEAETMLRRAVGIREQSSGLGRDLAESLLLLGLAYDSRVKYVEAESVLRTAPATLEKSSDPEDPMKAQVNLNLARVYISQRKVSEAETLFREALRVFEKEDPLRTSNTAVALNGLGLVHNERGQYSAAIPLFEKALEIFGKVHGPDFPDVATVLRNLAFSWQKLGDDRKARSLLERAARIAKDRSVSSGKQKPQRSPFGQ